MLDFLFFKEEQRIDKKSGAITISIYPDFKVRASKDLMIRGKDFYAIWDEENGIWSMSEDTALDMIDNEMKKYAADCKKAHPDYKVIANYTYQSRNNVIDDWHKYVQRQMRDHYHNLNETLIFANQKTDKKNYATKSLSYSLEKGDISAYSELMDVLYDSEERHKIEWAIGSIITGASKDIQKFVVLYGSAGTGKSTVLNIIQKLFDGYWSIFDAKALGSATNMFALEYFKNNPLVAIQHDGDLSRIEDNTRLNSIVSHETMGVNEKYKSTYEARFNCFLFMGTNKPVKITDAKSGIIRRLIDVHPTGNKVSIKKYRNLMSQIDFELGAIAYHCKEVYLENPDYYDGYIPIEMIGATNDIYNFVQENFFDYKEKEYITLSEAFKSYKEFCNDSLISYPLPKRAFKEELKNYFKDFKERTRVSDGSQVWNVYTGLRTEKFEIDKNDISKEDKEMCDYNWLELKDSEESFFDIQCSDCPAQYANESGTPMRKWSDISTKLGDISTNKLHYVKVPENHIVIDFDLKDDLGNKSFSKNLEAANKFPRTYAEVSKSGAGIHLHYIYNGDVSSLSRLYDDSIEIKVFTGNSSLRRKLTKCNDIPIATINSGLPMKGAKNKMVNWDGVKSEKQLRRMIIKSINKEYPPHATKTSIDYIYTLLEDAYNSKIVYDISDLYPNIIEFAMNSTHNSDYCLKMCEKMKTKSEETNCNSESKNKELVFFDIEVFPNLFLVNWKYEGTKECVRMINPKPEEVEELMKYNLVGFNNRRYDNHILYARSMGYSNMQLYDLSQRIINGNTKDAFIGEAYNVSYTDVYDFCSTKQSLKKWEIALDIHHQELGMKWDEPVPEDKWNLVAEYCDNDVFATEAVFHARKADWVARQILASISGLSYNDTTNSHTTKIIFGNNRTPQSEFNYRNLAEPVPYTRYSEYVEKFGKDYDFRVWNDKGQPEYRAYVPGEKLPDGWSILPFFPGYSFDKYKRQSLDVKKSVGISKSKYRGEEVGEGGYVYATPGMYKDVALDDIASMHPSSADAEKIFGPYSKNFKDLLNARIAIKHNDKESIKNLLNGKLVPFVEKAENGEGDFTMKDLAQALKIAINSVYGLTSAKFQNPFKDPRNEDNIVAKRGALFMVNLKHEVQNRGFTVAHIKTDSIKIPNATNDILDFVYKYGKEYGYTFEHEATYDRICLVNDAVYIAKYDNLGDRTKNNAHANEWTATGTQFQVPYVFKNLFSHEKIEFKDLCETKSTTTALYLDMNEQLKENEHNRVFVGKVGSFCPVKEGCGGGLLVREEKDGRYSAVSGSKGYRWLESETIKNLRKEADINKDYYKNLVDAAVKDISKFGDFEWFIS